MASLSYGVPFNSSSDEQMVEAIVTFLTLAKIGIKVSAPANHFIESKKKAATAKRHLIFYLPHVSEGLAHDDTRKCPFDESECLKLTQFMSHFVKTDVSWAIKNMV